MKKQIILWLSCLTLFLFILSLPAYAGKGGGNKGGGSYGKADKQMMKEKHQYKKQEQYEYEQEYQQKSKKQKGNAADKGMEQAGQAGPDDAKGFIKQHEKKMEQERKELDKGSETGQQQREEHSRKWWRFWE